MTRPLAPVVVVLTLALAWPPAPASSTPEDDLAKAVDAYSQGRLPQARALLDSLTRDPGPMGGRAAYLLGVIDLQQEKFTWAMTAFEQAAAKLPVLADHAIYYRAVAAFHAGDYARAGDGFQELLIRYPTTSLRAAALFWKAESLWGIHSPDTPAAFRQYLVESGEMIQGNQGGHWNKVVQWWGPGSPSAQRAQTQVAQAWFDMGEALAQLHRWTEAAEAYRRIRWGYEGSPFWKAAYARLQALGSAHLLPPDTTPPEVFYQRAQADLGGGYVTAAREELERILSMPEGQRIIDDVLMQLGTIAYQGGRLDEAAGYFQREIQLRGSRADDALYDLERIALRRYREGDALTLARQLVRDYPQSPQAPRALYAIAEVRQDRGALGPAMGLFQEAGERFPATLWGQRALFAVGWVQFRSQEWGPARAAWLRMAQSPNGQSTPAALYWAARAAEAQGRSSLAAEEYRRVATQYPDSYYGQRGAARINMPLRAAVIPFGEPPAGEVPAYDGYVELEALAQVDDATSQLKAAAESAPPKYRDDLGALLSQRYAQQGDVRQGIATAEQVRDGLGGAGRGLPLILWQALYPQAFWEAITGAATRTGVDPYLIAGLIREESRFEPKAVSGASAYGLMQLVPVTARSAARHAGLPSPATSGLTDPQTNIMLGTVVLQELLQRYNRVDLALAAYNAGPDIVRSWQARRGGFDPDAFVEEIPYAETRGYVKAVLQSAAMYRWLYRDGHPSTTP